MSRISIFFDRTDLQSPGSFPLRGTQRGARSPRSYERHAAWMRHALERAIPGFEARERAEDFAVYLPPSDDAR